MLANKLMSALSGGPEDKLYVDDVFSTYLYTGNGSTQTINNRIDLAGKGGMVWVKARDQAYSHSLFDTARGATYALTSNSTGAQGGSNQVKSFTSSGYTSVEGSTYTNVSWTFRRAPKFFDAVIYTGNGASSRAIAHSLGQEVGMVMTKATSTTGNWNTYHRSATGDLVLNATAAQTGSKALVNSATTSTFTVSGTANTNAVTYVAYLFAHDPSADGIIQCGSFTTDGGGNAMVNLGWEPQYLMLKNASVDSAWTVLGDLCGWTVNPGSGYRFLSANTASAEGGNTTPYNAKTRTGFELTQSGFAASAHYIYLAIRRPNKPPTTGTQVYNAIARTGTSAAATVTGVGFAPDLAMIKGRDAAYNPAWFDRLRGSAKAISSNLTSIEATESGVTEFGVNGCSLSTASSENQTGANFINHFFKRAPGFFDVVCYTGNGAVLNVSHSLGAAPELMIVKNRVAGGYSWETYCATLGAGGGLRLNTTGEYGNNGSLWNNTAPTATVFTVGVSTGYPGTNGSATAYVAYLFATLPGISKVGSYTGNGATQTINCGFTTGARFILIKRTDSAGDWYIWDTTRGIVSANDPHLSLNTAAAEVTADDSVDPANSGFIVNNVSPTNINVNAGQYIFLAIS